MKWDPHLGGEANHHLPCRLAAGVFAETSQPMSKRSLVLPSGYWVISPNNWVISPNMHFTWVGDDKRPRR
jgi:hypothetical protein